MNNLKKKASDFLVLAQDYNVSQAAYLLGIDTMQMGINDSLTISANSYDNILTIDVVKPIDKVMLEKIVEKGKALTNAEVVIKDYL